MSRLWKVRLGRQAERDFADIVQWTTRAFGAVQAEAYAETIGFALQALVDGPKITGAKTRDEISIGIHTLHVARHGRKGRHFVVFRIGKGQTVDVLRLLHDSMDLARHIEPADDS